MMSRFSLPEHGEVAQVSIVAAYEELLMVSSRVLESAIAADWDSLVAYKASYLAQVERIQQMEEDGPFQLDAAYQQDKKALIQRILEQDTEIRQRLVSRRDELGRLIGDSRQRAAVARSYAWQDGGSPRGASVTDVRSRFTQKSS